MSTSEVKLIGQATVSDFLRPCRIGTRGYCPYFSIWIVLTTVKHHQMDIFRHGLFPWHFAPRQLMDLSRAICWSPLETISWKPLQIGDNEAPFTKNGMRIMKNGPENETFCGSEARNIQSKQRWNQKRKYGFRPFRSLILQFTIAQFKV